MAQSSHQAMKAIRKASKKSFWVDIKDDMVVMTKSKGTPWKHESERRTNQNKRSNWKIVKELLEGKLLKLA